MKPLFFITLSVLTLFSYCSNAQDLKEDLISTSGGYYSNSTSEINWTLGEVMVESYIDQVEQGLLHQSIVVTRLDRHKESPLIEVFPNPFVESIKVKTDMKRKYRIQIFNGNGQLVYNHDNPPDGVIDLKNFNIGIYYLKVIVDDSNKSVNEFKLIKSK